MTNYISERLKTLGIDLPPPGPPAAAYVMAATTGNTVFLSGHIAKQDGKPWVGKLGLDMNTETGKAAAKSIAIDLILVLAVKVTFNKLSLLCSSISTVSKRFLVSSIFCWVSLSLPIIPIKSILVFF